MKTITDKPKKPLSINYEIDIKADPDFIFKLLCPVQEYLWIPSWKSKLKYFPNGHMEKGIQFDEIMTSPILTGKIGKKTRWTAIAHDPVNYLVHFLLINDYSETNYKMQLIPSSNGLVKCILSCEYLPLNYKGLNHISTNGQAKILVFLTAIANWLKHYCETAKQYKPDPKKRKVLLKTAFSTHEILMVYMNGFLMKCFRDSSKRPFLRGERISIDDV